MIDFHAAQVRNHRRNIERYCAIAGCLRPSSPNLSGSICTNGSRRNTLTWSDCTRQAQQRPVMLEV